MITVLLLSAALLGNPVYDGPAVRVVVATAPPHRSAPSKAPARTRQPSAAQQTVDAVAAETSKLVSATERLVWVTGLLALATFFAVIVPLIIDAFRQAERRRRDDDVTHAARNELIVFLRLYEAVIAALCTSPRDSIASQAELTPLLFERALALDIATTITAAKRAELYRVLAVAQHAVIDARARQAELHSLVETFSNERTTALETLARGARFTGDITVLQVKLLDTTSVRQERQLADQLAQLKAEQVEFNAGVASATARKFLKAETARSTEISDLEKTIRDNATEARSLLQAARLTLGDDAPVDVPYLKSIPAV